MRPLRLVLIVLATAATSVNALAQFVKGNEAVTVSAAGVRHVETPPFPPNNHFASRPPCAASANCYMSAWLMVETSDELMECTEPYARPNSCRASTYGVDKRERLWVVKSKGQWLQCQYPDLASKCVNMFLQFPANLPYSALQ